ncbi:MAG: hypothetical protein HZB26_23625 [Candidatus Hydrogenedentes bacterium]|nr:hypothetical protein [Candidatus Hydrogenedentota bacterium]
MRSQFFDTEYKLYRRYSLPDRLNLKEVQLEQYLKVLGDEDAKRRLGRLERLKDDFEAYPPFWYQIGLAAQESGQAPLALQYYERYEGQSTKVLREDQDYVMLCMHRIMLLNRATERKTIERDLASIERNTKYYYKWENILFAALTYYDLDDAVNARRLIQTSINEGYNVTLHQDVLVTMESNVARAKLKGTQRDLVASTEGNTSGTNALTARASHLERLRALGHQLTDISLEASPRSRGGTNAKFAVPVYNVYLLGRSAVKGDIYLDDCVLHMPVEWFSTKDKPTVTLFFGEKHRPSGRSTDKKAGVVDLTFTRVFNEDEVLEKGKELQCSVAIANKSSEMVLRFTVKQVTDELLAARPQLSKDKPYFELMSIDYQGEKFKFDNGLILPAS